MLIPVNENITVKELNKDCINFLGKYKTDNQVYYLAGDGYAYKLVRVKLDEINKDVPPGFYVKTTMLQKKDK